jgi:hypothetical protein
MRSGFMRATIIAKRNVFHMRKGRYEIITAGFLLSSIKGSVCVENPDSETKLMADDRHGRINVNSKSSFISLLLLKMDLSAPVTATEFSTTNIFLHCFI